MAYEDILEKHASRTGVDVRWLKRMMTIESGGRAREVTGSFKGLFQLSESEFRNHGGTPGMIFDPDANTAAAANKIARETLAFKKKYGKDPTLADMYMIHQQGEGGYAAHMRNPDELAWKNMASTKEGREKGEAWAKAAIWGNVPQHLKARYGSVDNMTSRNFTDMWASRIEGSDVRGGEGEPRSAVERVKNLGGDVAGKEKLDFLTAPEPRKGTFLGFGDEPTPRVDIKIPSIQPINIPLGGPKP